MITLTQQATSQLLMVRPAAFGFNPETATTNDYQRITTIFTGEDLSRKAIREFDHMVQVLRGVGIDVLVLNDSPNPPKPDAVFPNNWIVTFEGGKVFLFPMRHPSRSLERRDQVLNEIREHFKVSEIVDLSDFEQEDKALEGTGSLVLDRVNKVAYACLSPRTDESVLRDVCKRLNYYPMVFGAHHSNGSPIYHTNVVLSIGNGFAVFCPDAVADEHERERIFSLLRETNHEVVEMNREQQERNFACNVLQVNNATGKQFVVLSQSALDSYTSQQRSVIEKYAQLLPVTIPTIESIGGGSARCMLAEVFLKRRE